MEKKTLLYVFSGILFLIFFYFLFLSAPLDFPEGAIVEIELGSSLRGVSLKLKEEHVIRSRMVFEAFIIFFGREKGVISTDYYFENKLPVFAVARRVVRGEHFLAPLSVTIPEGYNINQIADTFSLRLPNFSKSNFLEKAKDLEGRLFPDTYFFINTDNEEDVINSMNSNFTKKITPLLPEITASGKKEKDIIIMASIIEKEAKGDADRAMISGILWKRISIGMPLQVDAAPETYKSRGLTKSAISNPGLEAIKSAIYPQKSPYLYYLHDKNGGIHYAKNFSEHQSNEQKYLR
ncbi:MAG TPA: endolytic transglycosylase MltG [Candidatus Paceibacterota bacterium]